MWVQAKKHFHGRGMNWNNSIYMYMYVEKVIKLLAGLSIHAVTTVYIMQTMHSEE